MMDKCPTCNGKGVVKHECSPVRVSVVYAYSYGRAWVEQCSKCLRYYYRDYQPDPGAGSSDTAERITKRSALKWIREFGKKE